MHAVSRKLHSAPQDLYQIHRPLKMYIGHCVKTSLMTSITCSADGATVVGASVGASGDDATVVGASVVGATIAGAVVCD